MGAKNEILKVLERHRGQNVSGEKLAEMLSISRNAVWKAIRELKKEGFEISAATNKGYCLSKSDDQLSSEGIGLYLKQSDIPIYTYKSLESTNKTAKKLALEGAEHGTVVLAEEQTMGKGRLGRSFFSPANSGIYLSVILRPQMNLQDSLLITVAASVLVARAIEVVTGIFAQIKWVNDIFVNGKKVCGILTEAVTDFESGNVEYIVLGIGLNFSTKQTNFPKELEETAGSLFEGKSKGASRNRLIAEIINNILDVSANLADREFMPEYKNRSLILHKNVQIIGPGFTSNATVLDIDDDGAIVVENEEGIISKINSGEVSIRGWQADCNDN